MVTKNLKNILAATLQASSVVCGTLPVKGVDGKVYYICPQFSKFPSSLTETFAASATAAGISIGRGDTAATDDDYNLESTITSGVSVSITSKTVGCDAPGAPFLEYVITVTNTGSSAISIKEIGYKQTVKAASGPRRTTSADVITLIDRTVLDAPVTIEAGDAGVIDYTLKTAPVVPTKGGVELVSWTYGSDEQIAAMIDAAQAGTIDLQADAGWSVGDVRTINISAFTGGNNVAHAAQKIDIAISSFSDYNECGCVMQFDFVQSLAATQRMNATNTNAGGYAATEMYTTTLPALVEALPTWLKERLITFNVLASAGSQSATISTIGNNKLALRSEVEIFGTVSNSKAGEGSQIPYYTAAANRIKTTGWSGSASNWWERSPNGSTSNSFCYVSNNGSAGSNSASNANGVAPFGCI